MVLLALDTCTERLVVGVRTRGGAQDRWVNRDSEGNHARDILSVVQDLLQGERPDAIGVAVGPGSFTGVRIGLSTAKGLSEGWKVPLVALDNLTAMADAWNVLVPGSPAAALPAIDARKKKYYGMLRRGANTLVEASDWTPEAWVTGVTSLWPGPVVLTGYQGNRLAEALGSQLPPHWSVLSVPDWTPQLLDQTQRGAEEGRFLRSEAGPRYLRLSEAEENLLDRQGSGRSGPNTATTPSPTPPEAL